MFYQMSGCVVFGPNLLIRSSVGNLFTVSFLLIAVCSSCYSQSVDAEQIGRLDQAALSARRAINSCELIIRMHSEFPSNGRPSSTFNELRYLVDRTKSLCEHSFRDADRRFKWIKAKNCVADGYFFSFTEGGNSQEADTQKYAANFSFMSEKDPLNSDNRSFADPRLIGFIPHNYLVFPESPLDKYVGNTIRTDVEASKEEIGGFETLRVSFHRKPTIVIRYWVSPSQGNSIVRMELEEPGFTSRVTLVPKLDALSNLWFPASYEVDRFLDGKHEEHIKAQVEVISLNQPIAPERFNIESMGLPTGTVIVNIPPDRRTRVWDGNNLVEPNDNPSLQSQSSDATRKWLQRGAIIFACAGVFFLLQYFIRRRKNKLFARN